MASERIRYFDVAKGILIILLVFAHFRSAVIRLPYESQYFEFVYGWNNIFTCFYMPAFFVISGYCSNFQKPVKVFIYSLLKSLLLPIVTLSLLVVIVTSLIYHQDLLLNLKQCVLHGGEFWFLWALLWGKAIVYIVEQLKLVSWYNICVTFLCLIVGVALNQYDIGKNYLYFHHALIASFWISIGVILRSHPIKFDKFRQWSLYIYPIVAIASFIKEPTIVASISISILTIPIHLVYSFFGTMFILAISKKIGNCTWLEFWGKNSLVVYALHFVPLLYFAGFLWNLLTPESPIIFIFYLFVLYLIEYSTLWLLMIIFNHKSLSWMLGRP